MGIMHVPQKATTNELLGQLSLLIALDLADLTDDLHAVRAEVDLQERRDIACELSAYTKSARFYDAALKRLEEQRQLTLEDRSEVARLGELMKRLHSTTREITALTRSPANLT